ncbi:50S ribosomal protein L30 [Salinisphaera sp. USBA-960]|uniref:50S ribosomal protein L30 n=1 Tax=Salinisphaera orenii TaxID=856731 RepID=UPI000DBE018F|nr:50S ribosomal protein L30 [Salifodinibacter halophilus]NNC26674.1 50S ribosomal protein L30 [Salifodinibacter halophilus]
MADTLKITLNRGLSGQTKNRRACVRGLGLKRRQHQVVVADTPENRGMINKVADMISVERA